MFLRGYSDHQDQLFCHKQIRLPGLANRVPVRKESLAVWLGVDEVLNVSGWKLNDS